MGLRMGLRNTIKNEWELVRFGLMERYNLQFIELRVENTQQ